MLPISTATIYVLYCVVWCKSVVWCWFGACEQRKVEIYQNFQNEKSKKVKASLERRGIEFMIRASFSNDNLILFLRVDLTASFATKSDVTT
jgi:hypothetical protein